MAPLVGFPRVAASPYPGYGFTAVYDRVARTGASSAASGIGFCVEILCTMLPGGTALIGLQVHSSLLVW
ncbi:hypothetical protein ACMYSL_00340 [Klebsiella sp. MISC125]|uniref:hypothetical protein n=1 Tax=Klebsiella sp. MISC125 TaxID=2755386 RepID=UPI003DA92545